MFKHANTYFVGDSVRYTGKDGVKLAAQKRGSVKDVDPGMELAHIEWENGTWTWEDLSNIEKI